MRGQHFHPQKPGLARPDEENEPVRSYLPGVNVPLGAGIRKKGTGVRPWLLLDSTGEAQVVEAGKHAIMRRTGLPARDLRILDPLLSYPSTILGREKAIVINLEHIKAIIAAQEVFVLNARDPSVTPFVEELQKRVLRHHQATKAAQDGNGDDSDWRNLYDLGEPRSRTQSPNYYQGFPQADEEEGKEHEKQGLENREGLKVLPFEFVALEACLEAACSCLESEVRDELEHLLDDDEDMAEMYLTEKMVQQQLENSSTSSIPERDEMDDAVQQSGNNESSPPEISLEGNMDASHVGRDSHGTRTSTTQSAIGKHLDVEELEMLLEAYFVQIDGTLNKLSTLREYVDHTEDYINIMLDDKQNHLLQMGVMLTTATLVVSAFIVVAGIFEMNIHIELFEPEKAGMPEFLWTVGGGTTGTILLYVVAIAWCKHKRLLE
ncbi:magnesium transporter MRS2-3-like isoform X2 [Cucurbita moschata]|uniref:Magnesium transporter n=1 Tax=Cucurbita moschata TaxID=3662 RepID=A0A6J1GJV3_CUCMO|nr:magnesium transporter MRS2-3-like isoform X2 [Cucurbita moschata]